MCIALLYLWDLKATQMNEQNSLNQEHMLYKFKLGYNNNTIKATKNICCTNVDHITVTR